MSPRTNPVGDVGNEIVAAIARCYVQLASNNVTNIGKLMKRLKFDGMIDQDAKLQSGKSKTHKVPAQSR